MDADTTLVVGALFVALAVPALIAAWADQHKPVVGTLLLFGGCAMIAFAWRMAGGYSPAALPDVLYRVIGNMMG
ncbi:hypothetical protein J4E08_07580 [Sagittula sp. NFXS13]|uniref:hypothetical protein n=1 Tax=Sagittula sp. NFXS13 TaxID=2819095 RepID=UPI0032DEB344